MEVEIMARRSLVVLSFMLLLVCVTPARAQPINKTIQHDKSLPWYIGVKGGVSFGVSTFSSFTRDKTYPGWNFGLYSGYKLNHILSAEISATLGEVVLGSSTCCDDYWLGINGIRYIAPVLGEEGGYYQDLYSSVSLMSYGLHLNIDLLPLLNPSTTSRLNIILSPSLNAISTQATIKTSATKEQFIKHDKLFNFGSGVDISAGYKLNDNLKIRLSVGVNKLVNSGFDGIMAGDHQSNYILNNSISVICHFGKK